jgi:hypothetical protein
MQGKFGGSRFIHRPNFQQVALSDAQFLCGVALIDGDFQQAVTVEEQKGRPFRRIGVTLTDCLKSRLPE